MTSHSDIALSISNLSASYNKTAALENISLTCMTGKITGIIGPNGAGKSTLVKACFNLLEHQTGDIKIFGKPAKTQLNKLSYVAQSSQFDWHFPITVEDVVLMGRYQHRGLFKSLTAQDHKIAAEALAQTELTDFRNRQINELSGGQKQRMIIARALAQQAEIFFLDEPFAGVDVKSEKMIINLLKDLRDQGKTIFCIHHDLQSARHYFDDIILLNKKLIGHDVTQRMLSAGYLGKAYNHQFCQVTLTVE